MPIEWGAVPANSNSKMEKVGSAANHRKGCDPYLRMTFLKLDQLIAGKGATGSWLLTLCLAISGLSVPAHANVDLARQQNCLVCHAVDRKMLGPAYKVIAAKYDGQPGAVETLTAKVMQGGSGVWGSAAMPANRVAAAEAKQLVEWILTFKQNSAQELTSTAQSSVAQKPAGQKTVTAVAQPLPKNPADQEALERGRYLIESVLACGNCHSGNPSTWGIPGKPMSGGRSYDTPEHYVTAGNLTSDLETGLGGWTVDDFKRALVDGTRPNGIPLAPAMPWAFFKALTQEDLSAVANFLVTLPPVRNTTPAPVYRKEFHREVYPDAARPFTKQEIESDQITRGRYLAALGHCMGCHTPVVNGESDFVRDGGRGGKRLGPNRLLAPNITSHPTAGLGNWSDEEIKRSLTMGVSRDGRHLGFPMPWRYLATLKAADVDALVAWLRTLPPKE